MAKHSLFYFSIPVPGKEKEFENWYTEHHIPEMNRIPGVAACQVYKVSSCNEMFNPEAAKFPYVYINNMEMEVDGPEGLGTLLYEMQRRRETGEVIWTDAMQEGIYCIVEPFTERIASDGE